MNKNFVLLNLFFLCLFPLFKLDSQIIETKTDPKFKVNNNLYYISKNTIFFKDYKSFFIVYNEFLKNETSTLELEKWELKNNFISFRSITNKILENMAQLDTSAGINSKAIVNMVNSNANFIYFSKEDSTINSVIENEYIGAICNQDGIFYIGKSAFRIFKDYVFENLFGNVINLKNISDSDVLNIQNNLNQNDLKIYKYRNSISNINSIASNGPCGSFNEVSASYKKYKIKLQLYLESWSNGSNYNTYLTCGSISYRNNVQYKTKHNITINNIKVKLPNNTYKYFGPTSKECGSTSASETKKCVIINSTYLGTSHYTNYKIENADIRATHRGMNNVWASFTCP